MGRNVVNTMDTIFEVLKNYVSPEDQYRIADVKRHIRGAGDENPIIDFVKNAKMIHCEKAIRMTIYEYNGQYYLMISNQYQSTIENIGLELENDSAIIQGVEMLGIANNYLTIKDCVSSLIIIEKCLGIEDGLREEKNVIIDFCQIYDLFEDVCVFNLDNSRFCIEKEEDIDRLQVCLLAEQGGVISEDSRFQLKELAQLLSIRSIATSILNGLQMISCEYSFLQFYQCLEYLFKLNQCFNISAQYGIPKVKALDIVINNEFRISERDNLYRVLKDNILDVDLIKNILKRINLWDEENGEQIDEYKKFCNYIYNLRCNVAHYRYNQEDTSMVDWGNAIDSLITVISAIYQKCDNSIIEVCNEKNVWKNLKFII